MSSSKYGRPTLFIDSDHPDVAQFAAQAVAGADSDAAKARALYYAVRDGIYYDPYRVDLSPEAMRASAVLGRGYAFCIPKAVLLAAAARAVGIPSRLGFGDVRNHLATERLLQIMQTDLFLFHGYTELFIGDRWVKATPAFNRTLCERFHVTPLEFDGVHDSLFQEFDRKGNRYMEYVRDRGHFADLPLDEIRSTFREHYPQLVAGSW